MDITTVQLGDVIRFKKPHPCGGYEWLVKRTGVDFKLECTTCKHLIMIPRIDVVKRLSPKQNIGEKK
ncbi:MAG: DUF951 domain-containing protein [Bacilli bacterium]|nr:DUF951 domain-containing protein [Bacilli bacterium]